MKRHKKILFIIVSFILLLPLTSWADEVLRLEIKGVKGPALTNVTTRLKLLQNNHLDAQAIKVFFNKAPKTIKSSLEPFGYFKADVLSQLTHQGSTWIARFTIYPGPTLTINRLDLQVTGPGRDNPALQKVVEQFPLQPGQAFNAEIYDEAKQKLFATANNQGYIKAVLDKKSVQINLKTYTADIVLHFNTNARYYIGAIHFNEAGFTEEFLRRFLPFHEGDPFSSKKLLKFQQNLTNSHYFSEINVTPELQNITNDTVPISITLRPNKSQQYNVGLGYGTFTGPRLTIGTDLRHLTKTGHHMNVQLRLSPILSGLAAQYIIPGKDPLTDQYTIGANAQRFTPKNGTSTSQTFFVGHTKNIYGWKSNLTLNYLREYYDIYTNLGTHSSRILYPNLELSRVKADHLLNPSRGYKISLNIRGASKQVFSHSTFAQSELIGKVIFSPTENSHILLRSDLGYTSVNDLTTLPLSLQFFAGGLDSVRGFPYSYFGPGRYLKIGSVEFQHRLYNDFYGAVFFDVGTAGDHFNDPLGKGVGVGLIYNSIVGPIRGYVGTGRTQGRPNHTSFELSMGRDL